MADSEKWVPRKYDRVRIVSEGAAVGMLGEIVHVKPFQVYGSTTGTVIAYFVYEVELENGAEVEVVAGDMELVKASNGLPDTPPPSRERRR